MVLFSGSSVSSVSSGTDVRDSVVCLDDDDLDLCGFDDDDDDDFDGDADADASSADERSFASFDDRLLERCFGRDDSFELEFSNRASATESSATGSVDPEATMVLSCTELMVVMRKKGTST